MRRFKTGAAFTAALLAVGGPIRAEPPEDARAILEVGATGEWGLNGGSSSYGPNIVFETTLIENWLEIEAGTTPFIHHSGTEWDTDFLFKKPYTLSRTVEFMAGVGPSWSHSRDGDHFGIEVAGDFMFWPWDKSRFGWYAEPSYGYSFAKGHEQSLSLSIGLLIAIP
jgi:hypothetical protein